MTTDLNLKLVLKTNNKLAKLFNSKIRSDREKNDVIYYINCDQCNSGYIGEKVDLKIRMYSWDQKTLGKHILNKIKRLDTILYFLYLKCVCQETFDSNCTLPT